ncbi:type VII toxin-antitoxin system MntA family adenylyltransferase antitoxin [Sporosarcina limicola]|uniref:Nucleotidyltransferase n=1 Tax=Sporosarcina limicola TaxID=34101 RepID=A0A927R6K7_9BACL|nr:nucleotidyltransferase domain-containing protein [Sporosarcina limicola]MBE1555074.1 putative nucleotidyltransferase [Sporosarcina limicola]
MLREEVRNLLVDKIVQKLNPAFILLFGSYAKGTAHAESDIDLAYLSGRELSSYERFILASELAELAGYEVDLVDIRQIDTVFTMQIFEQGIPIYIQDENEFMHQKMRAYSMYAALSEQRAPIIEAIKERGSVFGDE